jgi:hypothetical protein
MKSILPSMVRIATWTLVRELSYQMDREQSYQYTSTGKHTLLNIKLKPKCDCS